MESSVVIGVDTHKESHSAALVDAWGRIQKSTSVSANGRGYQQLLGWAARQSPQRIWVIEGTGSYGAGLASYLGQQGEVVFEGDRPRRPARGASGKSDALDAIQVAREALARSRHALPRCRGEREMMRILLSAREGAVHAHTQGVNQLQALVTTAPERLRGRLRDLRGEQLVKACLALRSGGDPETALTAATLRSVARRLRGLSQEAATYERQLTTLVQRVAPRLLAEPGVGTLTGAQILVSWSHAGRLRSEAAFAALAGTTPIPASSGKVQRHRLNRFGDRRLNRALHTIVLSRSHWDSETQAYIKRRTAEGMSGREIRRCLKRYLARRLFRLLESLDRT